MRGVVCAAPCNTHTFRCQCTARRPRAHGFPLALSIGRTSLSPGPQRRCDVAAESRVGGSLAGGVAGREQLPGIIRLLLRRLLLCDPVQVCGPAGPTFRYLKHRDGDMNTCAWHGARGSLSADRHCHYVLTSESENSVFIPARLGSSVP